MLDVIRRVISGEEFHDAVAATEEEATTAEEMNQQHTNTMTTQGAPTLVENDQDMDIDVDVAVDMDVGVTHIASASETPRSSLSDVSAAAKSVQEEYEQMMSEEAPMHVIREQVTTNLNQGRANLPRSDSKASSDSSNSMRGSSQNSSRDWGWFEDVHTNEQMTPHQKRKEISDDKGSKKKGKKGGRLVPLVDAGDPSHGLEIIHTVRDNGKLTPISDFFGTIFDVSVIVQCQLVARCRFDGFRLWFFRSVTSCISHWGDELVRPYMMSPSPCSFCLLPLCPANGWLCVKFLPCV